MRLTTRDHDRDAAGLIYVYPVVSRRAGGVSVGVNLNPNRACNWRCVYCQVPDLVRGAAPEIDLERLEGELATFLEGVLHGGWMERVVPEGSRRLNDVAFSGDGEPTSSRQFDRAVERVGGVLERLGLVGEIAVVLITNGSLVHRANVQRGLRRLAELGGEVWFKLDAGTREGTRRLNDVDLSPARVEANLRLAASLCRTRLQTMALAIDGEPPSEHELCAWIELVRRARDQGAAIEDVLLYGLERPSRQPEAPRLGKLPEAWLAGFASRVENELGLSVRVHP